MLISSAFFGRVERLVSGTEQVIIHSISGLGNGNTDAAGDLGVQFRQVNIGNLLMKEIALFFKGRDLNYPFAEDDKLIPAKTSNDVNGKEKNILLLHIWKNMLR